MPSIDPRFKIAADLMSAFIDKDSGEPLAGGIITFYSDASRATLKPIYQITDNSPNYLYNALPNPIYLSAQGILVDNNGNPITAYYYPFEGTPADNTGTPELYYITIYSNDGNNNPVTLQATKLGWPNTSSDDDVVTEDENNFIPNGQFLAHNTIVSATQPPRATVAYGPGSTVYSQAIAQGGWNVKTPSAGGAGVYSNSFTRIATAISGVNDFPRWAFNFKCTTGSVDAVRDLSIDFRKVNKFSGGNPVGSQDYTLWFNAQSNDANTYTFELYRVYNYGSNASASDPAVSAVDETLLTTIQISPGYSAYQIALSGFPAPAGTVGTNDDDTVSLVLRGPASNTWDVQVTDFALLHGSVALTSFPVQPDSDMLAEGVAGWMPTPNPDGSDLYLPLVLTSKGMVFDDSDIGSIRAGVRQGGVANNELLCDGTTYFNDEYSSLGIPYSRLFNKLYSSTYKAPLFGGGYEYLNAYVGATDTTSFRVSTNKAGNQTDTADVSTTWTILKLRDGQATANVTSYMQSATLVEVKGNFKGLVTAPADGAAPTGFTVSSVLNNANLFQRFTVDTSPGLPPNSSYFTFRSSANNGAGTNDAFYVWYDVDGAGVDPAPGGTGIQVYIKSTWNTAEVAQATKEAMIGAESTFITAKSEAATPANSYFEMYANGQKFVVWINKNGAGTQPVVASAKFIAVPVTTGDSAATVASNTVIAINSAAYGVPDARGAFLRGQDSYSQPNWDIQITSRLSPLSNGIGGALGSIQWDEYANHTHAITDPGHVHPINYYVSGAGGITGLTVVINATGVSGTQNSNSATTGITVNAIGSNETRPPNLMVQWLIKY